MTDKPCLTCRNWLLKDSPAMARHHFARCAHGPAWKYLPPLQTCDKHAPVDDAKAAQRLAWNKG
jgi:hypothetical protein